MTQINTQSIQTEFNSLSTYKKTQFAQSYGIDTPTVNSIIAKISGLLGNRIFMTTSQTTILKATILSNRANQVLLSLDTFTNDILVQSVDILQALMCAELLSRYLGSLVGLPDASTSKELVQMRSKIQTKLYARETEATQVANQFTGSSTDLSDNLDPLNRKREYMFYDAFAIIRGPRSIVIVDFNNEIMSVTTNLTTDINPGTFEINFANPLEQYVDDSGNYAFYTGDSINIYATRRFKSNTQERYIGIFWGIIEKITDSYSDGSAKITLSGQDIVAWLQYTTITLVPSFIQTRIRPTLNDQPFINKYTGMTLVEALTSVIFNDWGGGYLEAYSLFRPDANQQNLQQAQLAAEAANKTAIQFWTSLFLDELKLKLFGYIYSLNINGIPQTGGQGVQAAAGPGQLSSANININNQNVTNYTLLASSAMTCAAQKMLENYIPVRAWADVEIANAMQLEDMSKLEVIRRLIEGTMFEFFMDVDGSLVCKPPFYNEYPANNDTNRYKDNVSNAGGTGGCQDGVSFLSIDTAASSGPAYEYTIKDMDVISFTIQEDSSAIVTAQQITMEPQVVNSPAQEANPGYAQNNDLIRRYGIRYGSPKKMRTLGDLNDGPTIAKAVMDYSNTKYYTGSIQIIGRPEIHLGRTIYFEPRNVIFYVIGISHNFTAGGTFTTTLTVVAGRRMFLDSKGKPLANIFDGEQFNNRSVPTPAQDISAQALNLQTLEANIQSLQSQLQNTAPNTPAANSLQNQLTQATNAYQSTYDQQALNLQNAQNQRLFDQIRKDGFVTPGQVTSLGIPPRRISDSFGRRLYGTLPYGLMVTPPKQQPQINQTKSSNAAKNSSPATSALAGAGTQNQVPASPGTAGAMAIGAGLINTGNSTAANAISSAQTGGSNQQVPGDPLTLEKSLNCATGGTSKSFNISSIVKKNIVNGVNL